MLFLKNESLFATARKTMIIGPSSVVELGFLQLALDMGSVDSASGRTKLPTRKQETSADWLGDHHGYSLQVKLKHDKFHEMTQRKSAATSKNLGTIRKLRYKTSRGSINIRGSISQDRGNKVKHE